MSQYDLLYQLKPPVSALNAIAYTVCIKQFVVSLPAISLGDWFSVSKKGGKGGGGLV